VPLRAAANAKPDLNQPMGWQRAGIKPSSLIKDAGFKAQPQKLWLDWTDEVDAEGFYGFQRPATPRRPTDRQRAL
jgi:hypothetical protein